MYGVVIFTRNKQYYSNNESPYCFMNVKEIIGELITTSNTLTHPDNFEDRQKRRAEEL